MSDTPKTATYLYLKLTLAFSTVVWSIIIWSGHFDMGFGVMIPAMMWCPALAALTTCRLLHRNFRSLAWRWPRRKYLAAAYSLPVIYASVAYGAVWASRQGGWDSEFAGVVAQSLGLQGLPRWGSLTLYIVAMATGGVIQNLSMALGEEIGWRGFLVPELAKQMSFTKVTLLSGIVWACWHVPLLFAGYSAGRNRWYALACSSVTVISVGCILAWLRLKSHSLWPAALLHASHNLFVAGIFNNLIRNTGRTHWYTSQFGAALAITTAVCAIYFWLRRSEVERSSNERVLGHVVSLALRQNGWSSIRNIEEERTVASNS